MALPVFKTIKTQVFIFLKEAVTSCRPCPSAACPAVDMNASGLFLRRVWSGSASLLLDKRAHD